MRNSIVGAMLIAMAFVACDKKRVHVDVVTEVLVHDPAAAPLAGRLVTFRSVKFVDGDELDRSIFDLTRTTGQDGKAVFTVGYNVTTDEDVAVEAFTGNGTNKERELVTGGEILAIAATTEVGIVTVTRGLVLVDCPTDKPDYCAATCTNVRHDKANCGTCGHPCQVDCLEGSCIPCSSAVGTWTITGDCPVKACTVTQETCGGSVVCTKGDGSLTDPAAIVAGNGTLTFGASLGTCDVALTGDSFTGSCGNELVSCDVSGARQSR